MTKRSKLSFEIFLVFFILLTHVYAMFSPANSLMNWFSTDDAFYYYKTAQNISEGNGVTFDQISRSSGFHPLWMIICVPIFSLARFDPILPLRLLIFVLALMNAGASIFIFKLLKKMLSSETAILFALLWAFYPSIHGVTTKLGMESSLTAFVLSAFLYTLYCFERQFEISISIKQYVKLGILGAILFLCRLDTIYLVMAIGIWIIFKGSKKRFFGIFDFGLIVISVVASYFSRLEPGQMFYQYSKSFYWMVCSAVIIKAPVFYLFNFYNLERISLAKELGKAAIACLLSSLILTAVMLLSGFLQLFVGFPRMVLVVDLIITLIGILLSRISNFLYSNLDRKRDVFATHIGIKDLLYRGIRFYGPILIVLILYISGSYLYFGTPTPISGQIKYWWGSLPNTVYGKPIDSWGGFWGFIGGNGPWSLLTKVINSWGKTLKQGVTLEMFEVIILISIILLILILAFLKRKLDLRKVTLETSGLLPLFTGCIIHIVMYTGTSYVNMRVWYWIPEMMFCVILFAILIEWAFQFFNPNRKWIIIKRGFTSVLVIILLSSSLYDLIQVTPWNIKPSQKNGYIAGILALESNTEPGAIIGSPGGGVVAYFIKNRNIVNLDGLMNSVAYFKDLKQYNISEYIKNVGVNYIYGNSVVITASDPYQEVFRNHLKFVGEIGGSSLYKYND